MYKIVRIIDIMKCDWSLNVLPSPSIYTRSVTKLRFTEHHLNSTIAIKFLKIVRLLRVILPCCEIRITPNYITL